MSGMVMNLVPREAEILHPGRPLPVLGANPHGLIDRQARAPTRVG